MINAINLEEPVEYICKEDRKSDNPTVWKFKPLTYGEECFIKKLSLKSFKDGSGESFIDNAATFLHVALIGADNVDFELKRDESKKQIIGKTRPWSDKTITSIPYRIRDELITFVIKGYSELKEDELKN